MVRLVLKIFLTYWIAAGVVIAISDLEPHRHIHNPELVDALDSSLAMNGRMITEAYEHDRCQSMWFFFGTRIPNVPAMNLDRFLPGVHVFLPGDDIPAPRSKLATQLG